MFDNWAAINSSNLEVNLRLVSNVSSSITIVNASSFFSRLFNTTVNVSSNDFEYNSSTRLSLAGEFVTIRVSSETQGDWELFNYSLTFYNPTNVSLVVPVILDFSNFETILLNETPFSQCPEEICYANGSVFVNVSNSTKFSIKAKRFSVTLEDSPANLGSQPAASFPPSGRSIVAGVNNSEVNLVNETSLANVSNLAKKQGASVDILESESISPSLLSGRAVQFSSNLWPFALLLPFGLLLFIPRKKLTKRVKQNEKTTLIVKNIYREKLTQLVLLELVNAKQVKSKAKKKKSVLGVALNWKKSSLKPGEEWIVSYNAASSGNAKLKFHKGKKVIETKF